MVGPAQHFTIFSGAVLALVGGSAALAVATSPNAATAQTMTGDQQQTAYLLGVKCYVANGVAATDMRYNANGSRSDTFRANAKKSYDFIWYMGRKIGKSEALIQEDIDSYGRMMPPAFLRNDSFFQRTRDECGQVGLM